jgi:hypothetical protein
MRGVSKGGYLKADVLKFFTFDGLFDHYLYQKKKKKDPEEQLQLSLHLIIPAIVASLVAQGLLPKDESGELESLSLSGIEDYLVTNNIFESKKEVEEWILAQPEIVGNGDSILGGIDHNDV